MDRVKVIAEEITWLVPKLLRGLRAGFIASPQVTTSQMVTLIRIYEKATTRLGNLSREMRVSPPTITGVVDRLVRNGYLRRTQDEEDRRAVNVGLTDKGKKFVEKILSEINKRWYKILARLTEEERENYLRILKRIVEVLSKEDV
ncbi:MAG: MarR family transcriptional regulator [Candidatus Omnitrophota bacterium]